ncbi:MAG: PHP domain-containing protein [Spirochaetales bacterium]|nr:PHP domain-containing protein [Spirochaetales bacterium]
MNTIDLHIHTVASGHGMNTLYEIVKTANEKKMKAIAITDHGPKSVNGPAEAYFYVLCCRVPSIIDSIHIIKGIEANILDVSGKTDIPGSLLPHFDLILAYMHPITMYRDQGIKNNTKAILNAFEKNPAIDILVHPVAVWYPIDIKRVVQEACIRGIALELNEATFKYQRLDKKKVDIFIEQTIINKGKFVISSDAHYAGAIGTDDTVREIIGKYSITDDYILNKNLDDVFSFIKERKKNKNVPS